MPEKKPSRQELNRRRRRGGFVGRHGELGLFRDNLARDPGDEAFHYLFHVHGQAGVGKTSLVRQWDSAARELGAATAYLDDDVHSVVEAMEAISAQLRRQGMPLKGFEKLLAAYRQRRHEAETPMGVASAEGAEGDGSASLAGTVMVQAGLAGLGLVPGMGPIAGAMDARQLAQSADRMRVALSARLRSHADVQLVMSPVRVLTPVFLEDLAEVAERRPWVVLFFDVFEQTGPVLDEWLRDILAGEEYPGLPLNVLAVLSGQGRLDARWWGDHLDLVTEVSLAVFTEDEARQLLAGRGVTDEDVVQVVLHLTGRLPVLVDTLALSRPQEPGEVADPSETAVDRFLRWITDPQQQDAARVCALPLQLDEDIYRATVPEATVDQYAWLRSLPFVTYQAGRCRYHDVVRDPMVRLQRTQSPARWQQQHTRLADVHQQRRHAVADTLPAGQVWDNATWHEHRLNETYHRLCARPGHALPEALRDVVHACDHGKASLRRWAQMLAQAGHDCADEGLTLWGNRLTAASREDTGGLAAALTLLVAAPALEDADRILAYTLRGREHRNAYRYTEALADYASALALDPGFARALYGRGETKRLMERYDEALPSLTRAIELEPDDSWNAASRGLTYQAMGRYDEALADQSRAIELAPDNPWMISNRAHTHRALRRYDEALADHDRAIALDPDNAWNVARRGLTYQAMGRHDDALADYGHAVDQPATRAWAHTVRAALHREAGRPDEALADFDRAISLDPDSALAFASRAETYRAMGRHEDALTDYDHAITLAPQTAWIVTSRAGAYRALGRHEDALADYDRAITLNPAGTWAITQRGLTHQAMGHLPESLADYDRAIALDPEYAWAFASRAEAYRALGRHEDALTDYDRAITLEPDHVWHVIRRGTAQRGMRRYDDALADYDRAVRLEPDNAWPAAMRGLTHRVMGHYDEALADQNRAITLDPHSAWLTANRGDTYRALGRHEDALTDYLRAVELAPDNAWYRLDCGIALRLLHRPEQSAEHLRRAREMYTAQVSAGGPQTTHARGNLMVVHCAANAWDEASAELDRFLACAPTPLRIQEALDDLADLADVLGVLSAELVEAGPLRRRLERARSVGEPT